MKSIIFITKILFCMLLLMPVISVYGNICEKKEEVILHGESETHKNRSLVIPVEAYTDGYQLTVTFFNATEDVTISITGNAGVMETRTVSFTDFQTEFLILDNMRPVCIQYKSLPQKELPCREYLKSHNENVVYIR